MNHKIIVILLVLGLILGFTSISMAIQGNTTENSVNNSSNSYNGTIYVSTQGNDGNDGFTPETSKKSIKKAVDKAPVNATILVAPGTYIEDTIHIKKSLRLIGENPETTIIKSKSTAIKVTDGKSLVKNFTITPQTYHAWYKGIWSKSGITLVENCILKGFNPIDGTSLYNYSATLVVKDCTIIDRSSILKYEQSLQ